MLNRLPRQLPALSVMLDDIGNPPARHLARALGVTERTVRRWMAADQAPHVAGLALFWVTRWGMSAAHCEAHNTAALQAAYASALADDNARLRAELARVVSLGDFGCANMPTLQAPPVSGQVLPFRAAARRPTGV